MSNTRKRKRQPGRKASRNRWESGNSSSTQSLTVRGANDPSAGWSFRLPRQLSVADSIIVPFRYILPIQTIGATGSLLNSLRFTSNAYDVDPALASTAMAGFGEWAAIYSRFRTLEMSYKFYVTNLDGSGKEVISGFMITSVSASLLGSNYAENPHMKLTRLGGSPGMGSCTVTGHCRLEDLFGTKQCLFDDLFTGSTTSSTLPTASQMNCYVGVNSPILPTAGFTVSGYVNLVVHMFRRNALIS